MTQRESRPTRERSRIGPPPPPPSDRQPSRSETLPPAERRNPSHSTTRLLRRSLPRAQTGRLARSIARERSRMLLRGAGKRRSRRRAPGLSAQLPKGTCARGPRSGPSRDPRPLLATTPAAARDRLSARRRRPTTSPFARESARSRAIQARCRGRRRRTAAPALERPRETSRWCRVHAPLGANARIEPASGPSPRRGHSRSTASPRTRPPARSARDRPVREAALPLILEARAIGRPRAREGIDGSAHVPGRTHPLSARSARDSTVLQELPQPERSRSPPATDHASFGTGLASPGALSSSEGGVSLSSVSFAPSSEGGSGGSTSTCPSMPCCSCGIEKYR